MARIREVIPGVFDPESGVAKALTDLAAENGLDGQTLDLVTDPATRIEVRTKDGFNDLMSVNSAEWKNEILSQEELFSKLYDKLPKEFVFMRELILSALWRSPEKWELTSEH